MKAHDFKNKEIKVGDTIIYPGRCGSGLWLNEAVVEGIESSTDWRGRPQPIVKARRTDRNAKLVTIYCLSRVVCIPK